jgi:hypothetical protein
MSNQYQQSNYKEFREGKPKSSKKGDCGCKHEKKMSGFVDTSWFKILGGKNKGTK